MISSHSRFDFGTLASGYDAWYETVTGRMHDAAQKEAVASLLPAQPPGKRPALLDVGCGTGHWSVFFAERGFEVTGVDLSPEMISVAQGRHAPHCRFVAADAMRLPFPDGEFEFASAMAALEFVSDASRACAEMIRCLKPGGCLLVGALNRLAVLNRKRISSGSGLYSAARMFVPAELRGLLSAFGRVSIRLTAEKKPGAFIVATVKKHIGEVIVRFTEELRTGGLKPETGAMSTVVQGECRKVFAAVQQAFEACGREAGIVLVLKAGNACSDCVPHIEKRSNRRRRHSL